MELASLDLNLLVVLNALLTERNVTRAGDRVGLSQPATSAALGRLRRHFDDELLHRVGTRYELTTLASSLLEQSDIALRYVENTFTARPVFDATTSTRSFSAVASDYALMMLGGALARLLRERAPNVRLHVHTMDRQVVDDAQNALRLHDALLLPRGYVSDLPSRELFDDDWVILSSAKSTWPITLSADDLSAARWVMIYDAPTQFTPPDKSLRLMGIDRHVDIVVENFASVPFLISDTDRLALVPRGLSERFPAGLGLTRHESPVALPTLGESVWWHPSRDTDPGHRWLLDLIVEAAADHR